MEYTQALAIQRATLEEVVAKRIEHTKSDETGVVFLVEHSPAVITVSRRLGARANLIATDEQLKRAGVVVEETDRGGDITYHGPGQLVVYPILDLNVLGLKLHGYMRMLEDVVIRVVGRFGITGVRDEKATGVWVAPSQHSRPMQDVSSLNPHAALIGGKICAMGVRVSRWVTMHGLALNVRTNLEHFGLIVPCGLVGRSVTSMERELGNERCPGMDEVKRAMVEELQRVHVNQHQV